MAIRFRRRDIRPTPTGSPVNQDIRHPQVRVIDDEGEQMGVMPTEEAIAAAEDRDLDLVEVSPNADPPVCKIMDYGRYKYTLQKKANEAKKKQKIVELKEVKMRIKIEEHDYATKKKHAERFLLDGNKAKVTIMFRGREVTHPDLGRKLLDRMANELIQLGAVEQAPLLEGRNMTMVIAPKLSKQAIESEREKKAKEIKETEDETDKKEKGGLKTPVAEAMGKAAARAPDEGTPGNPAPGDESGTGAGGEGEENAEA